MCLRSLVKSRAYVCEKLIHFLCVTKTGPLGFDDGASWNDATQGNLESLAGYTFFMAAPTSFSVLQIALGGRYSRDLFNRHGDLRHIRRLRFWPMNKVLTEKYEFSEQDANDLSDFLVSILDFVPEKRPTAAQCLLHPWISSRPRSLEPSLKLDTERKNEEQEAIVVKMGNVAISSPTSKPGMSRSSSCKQAI